MMLLRCLCLLLLIGCSTPSLHELPQVHASQRLAIQQFLDQAGEGAHVRMNAQHATPEFIRGHFMPTQGAPVERAMQALEQVSGILHVPKAADVFALKEGVRVDAQGETHVIFQQHFKGLPVFGLTQTVHFNIEGEPISISGNSLQNTSDRLEEPVISEQEAIDIALHAFKPGARVVHTQVLYVSEQGVPILSYQCDIAFSDFERFTVMVSAEDGRILTQFPHHHDTQGEYALIDFLNHTRFVQLMSYQNLFYFVDVLDAQKNISANVYSGQNQSLQQSIQVVPVTFSSLSKPISYTRDQADAVGLSYGIRQVFSYFKNQHAHVGTSNVVNNTIEGYVRMDTANTVTMFEVSDPSDSNTTLIVSGGPIPLTSCLDTVAHEYTHGVIEHTTSLVYANESGALNESLADLFGEATELYTTGSNDWFMAGELNVSQPSPSTWGNYTSIRSFANPSLSRAGVQPKYLKDYVQMVNDAGHDYGGVHTNSGITNYAFYLMVQNGMSLPRVASAVYDVLAGHYVSENTTLSQFAYALYAYVTRSGTSYTSNEQRAVYNALVSVGFAPTNTPPQLVLSLSKQNIVQNDVLILTVSPSDIEDGVNNVSTVTQVRGPNGVVVPSTSLKNITIPTSVVGDYTVFSRVTDTALQTTYASLSFTVNNSNGGTQDTTSGNDTTEDTTSTPPKTLTKKKSSSGCAEANTSFLSVVLLMTFAGKTLRRKN